MQKVGFPLENSVVFALTEVSLDFFNDGDLSKVSVNYYIGIVSKSVPSQYLTSKIHHTILFQKTF